MPTWNTSESCSPVVLPHFCTREIQLAVGCLYSDAASEAVWCRAGVRDCWLQCAHLGLPASQHQGLRSPSHNRVAASISRVSPRSTRLSGAAVRLSICFLWAPQALALFTSVGPFLSQGQGKLEALVFTLGCARPSQPAPEGKYYFS